MNNKEFQKLQHTEARNKFLENQNNVHSISGSAARSELIDKHQVQVANWIAEQRRETTRGPDSQGLTLTESLEPMAMAHTVLAYIDQFIMEITPENQMIQEIGEILNYQVQFERFQERNPVTGKRITKIHKNSAAWEQKSDLRFHFGWITPKKAENETEEQLRKRVERMIEPPWTVRQKEKVGCFALNAAIQTGLFAKDKAYAKKKDKFTSTVWIYTDEAKKVIGTLNNDESWKSKRVSIQPEEPLDWNRHSGSRFRAGPFDYQPYNNKYKIIAGAKQDQQILFDEALLNGDLDKFLESLNYHKSTPLMCNSHTYEFLYYCTNEKLSYGKIPHLTEIPIPEIDDIKSLSRRKQKAFTKRKRKIELKNRISIPANNQYCDYILDQFKQYVTEDKPFYQLYRMCDRTRFYNLNTPNFQQADYIRGLFLFAEKAEITARGIELLKAHSASLYDQNKISKAPFEDKVAWTNANLENILADGRDFHASSFWQEAKDISQYLAAARELALLDAEGWSDTFMTNLPISRDATQSGIQNLCLMIRSEEDGKKVNLTNEIEAQDVYGLVADKVNEMFKQDLNGPDNHKSYLAGQWLNLNDGKGVGRSECKRGVMTKFYAATEYGFGDQVMDDIIDPMDIQWLVERRNEPFPFIAPEGSEFADGFDAALYFAKVLWEAIFEVVPEPAAMMSFITELADILASKGVHLRYKTRLGFPFQQEYIREKSRDIYPLLAPRPNTAAKKTHRREKRELEGRPINKVKSKAASAPNLVHLHDAEFAHRVTLKCKEAKIPLLAVHDSFSTLAPYVDKLNEILRKTYVSMYRHYDFPTELLKQNQEHLTEDEIEHMMSIKPKMGTLNISDLPNCKHCFD